MYHEKLPNFFVNHGILELKLNIFTYKTQTKYVAKIVVKMQIVFWKTDRT